MVSNILLLISCIGLSVIVSVLITAIGISWYLQNLNNMYDRFMEEYAADVKDGTVEVIKEWMQTKSK